MELNGLLYDPVALTWGMIHFCSLDSRADVGF
jgi:hypothetical protein